MPIFKSNLRLVVIYDTYNNIQMKFSDNVNDSHKSIHTNILDIIQHNRDFNIPAYARFYSMLYGNSRVPQLIIYGTSSDYAFSDLDYHQVKYEKDLRNYAQMNNWDILFLP